MELIPHKGRVCMNKTVAIVVTYNRKELLQECLDRLMCSELPCDILLVDNNSTDGTKNLIAKSYKDKITYYNTGENIGGAGGFNFGLRKAYELGYQYFWLMDDDTMVRPDSLTELFRCDRVLKGNYGFLSSHAQWIDGSRCVMNYHSVADDWQDKSDYLKKHILKISFATFVSFFTKRDVVENVGLPIKEYFIWGDETEYSGRISRKYDCYYCFDSVVIHKMKENQGSNAFSDMKDVNRIYRMKLSVRNDLCTARKTSTKQAIKCIYGDLRVLLKCLLTKNCEYRWKKVKVLICGIGQGLLFNPIIEKI